MNGTAAGHGHGHGDQPDSDAIKMFIGQIPKVWGEIEVRELLEVYGHIYQLNILREKGSVISKGCCFVTFYTRKSALDAQNALHNIKTLQGMHHCVQMKPADSENKSEDRKLFVGMISKKLGEQDLRVMFSQFGTIEECRVLVNSDSVSKGCAFITYTNKVSAQNAIRSMHQSTTMEGCSAPIVVKIADSPKDKERKKVQSQLAQQLNQLTNQWKNIAALAPMLQTLSLHNNNNQFPMSSTNNQAQSQQALALAAAAAQIILNQQQQPTSPTSNGFHNNNQGVSSVRSLTTPPWNNQTSVYQSSTTSNGVTSTSPFDHISLGGSNYETSSTGISTSNMLSSLVPNNQGLYNQPMLAHNTSPAGSHREGPEGSNLFIYHLPAQFTDHDLMQAFMSFGSVISAKVFIDKQTNLSKCFGFVSYDNPVSAQHAIQTMHGYQIGMKRLKVQLKRCKSDSKSY